MAKFWPLHHYNQCMGENGRKALSTAHLSILAQLVGEGACQPDIFTKYRLGCELSYGSVKQYPIPAITVPGRMCYSRHK